MSDVLENLWEPLFWDNVRQGHDAKDIFLAECLLDAGADVNARFWNADGPTALLYVLWRGAYGISVWLGFRVHTRKLLDLVTVLLERGAEPTVVARGTTMVDSTKRKDTPENRREFDCCMRLMSIWQGEGNPKPFDNPDIKHDFAGCSAAVSSPSASATDFESLAVV